MDIRLAGFVKESVVEGPGIRLVVFFQGCFHNCPACHNPETHDPMGGYDGNTDDVIEHLVTKPLLAGLTLSGGEPLLQPAAARVLAEATTAFGKNIIVYTGYTWEEVQKMAETNEDIAALLKHTWLLIDGPFILAKRSFNTPFRGSANQRIIDVASSLAEGKIIEKIF